MFEKGEVHVLGNCLLLLSDLHTCYHYCPCRRGLPSKASRGVGVGPPLTRMLPDAAAALQHPQRPWLAWVEQRGSQR